MSGADPEKVKAFYKEGGRIYVLCGKSGVGKSYRAHKLLAKYPDAVVLDGDSVRTFVTSELTFSEQDRRKNNEIVAGIARLLWYQGKTVIVATVRGDIAYELLKDTGAALLIKVK